MKKENCFQIGTAWCFWVKINRKRFFLSSESAHPQYLLNGHNFLNVINLYNVGNVEVLRSIQIYFMKDAIVTNSDIRLLDLDEPK